MEHDRVEHYRKSATAGAMIFGPLALLTADSLWPTHGTKVANWVSQYASTPRWGYAATMLGVAGIVLMVGAVIGLAHMLHEREPGTAVLGGAMAIVGLMSIMVLISSLGMTLYAMTHGGRDHAQMASLLDSMVKGAAVPFEVGTLFATIGALILGFGLLRTHVVANWSAWAFMGAAVVSQVANPLGMQPLVVISDIAFLIGLGSIGWTVLSETDEEWVHTPVFHGMRRPVAG
jgi:hypothetical protein